LGHSAVLFFFIDYFPSIFFDATNGAATTRLPRAASQACRQSSKETFMYIKGEYHNLLAKYF
jgi:hypothetical protein